MKQKIWIPAILAVILALGILAYHYLGTSGGEVREMRPIGDGQGQFPGERPEEGLKGIFKTLGTISVYVGAAGFAWFWFKKRRKSSSNLVKRAGKLFHAAHELLGWATLILAAVHGLYFIFKDFNDRNVPTGLAAFAILLFLAGYGMFITKIRNKWTRIIHRTLGILWVPFLLIHAGGSAIIAAFSCLAVGAIVWYLDRQGKETKSEAVGSR